MRRIGKIRFLNNKILCIGILPSANPKGAHHSFLGIDNIPAVSPDGRNPHKRCEISGKEQTVTDDEFGQASRDFSAVKLPYQGCVLKFTEQID